MRPQIFIRLTLHAPPPNSETNVYISTVQSFGLKFAFQRCVDVSPIAQINGGGLDVGVNIPATSKGQTGVRMQS